MSSEANTERDARRTQLFVSLCGLIFLVNFGRVSFAPLLEPMMREFAIGEATAGLVATLAWLGSALPRLPTGYLLTRFSRTSLILGAALLLAGASAFTAAAPTVAVLGVGAFLVGTSSGVYFTAALPLVTELFPDRVGRALGVHATASQVAAVAAPALVVAALLVGEWWWVFVGLGLAALVVTGALVRSIRAADLPTAGKRDRALLLAARREWRIIAVGVAVMGCAGFVWNGLFNFYVPYLAATKALSLGTANLLLTVLFAAGVPTMLLVGRLADRFSHVRLVLGGLSTLAAGLFGLVVSQDLLAVAVVTIALGTAFFGLIVATDTYLLSALPDERRASAYSTYSAIMMVVQATGSVVLGTLVEAGVGYDAAFRSAGVVLGVVVVALLALALAGRIPAGASTAA